MYISAYACSNLECSLLDLLSKSQQIFMETYMCICVCICVFEVFYIYLFILYFYAYIKDL